MKRANLLILENSLVWVSGVNDKILCMSDKKTNPKTNAKLLKDNRGEVKHALEVLFASDYVDSKKLYLENFIRGIVFGAGGVIGATLLVALVVWILSLFDEIPVIGPLFDETKQTIQGSQDER